MNLENLNVQELNTNEMKNVDGGAKPAYYIGYYWGSFVSWLEKVDAQLEGPAV